MPLLFLKEEQDPRVPEGMARLARKDADIAALKQQIAKLEDEKADIQTELAKIQGQDVQQSNQDQGQEQNNKASQEELAQKVAAAVTAATSESLIERVDGADMDEEDRIINQIDDLADEIVFLRDHNADPEEIKRLNIIMRDLQDELAQLELDQMEHEAEYDEEDYWIDPAGGTHYGDDDDPAAMYEGYASKFRPGKMLWKGRTFNIDKVENVNDKMDVVYVDGKMMNSKHLEADGAEMAPKPRKEREKRMTKREYEKTLKDVMSSAGTDLGELDHSIVYDLAENLYYDPTVRDYVARRWKKENGYTEWYDTIEPSKREIIETITNDLEMSESHNPISKKNFYKLSEAYVERTSDVDDDYVDEEYVFYVRITEDGNEFIGKIFKISPDGDWFGLVKEGESDTFQKISYEPEYDENDIIKFLGENYDEVEIIGSDDYNEYIEESLNESDNSKYKYRELWDSLDKWSEEQPKWPSWRAQKRWIRENADNYGINIPDKTWGKILKRHDELHNDFYFQGWDIDQIPWLEKQIDKYNEVEESWPMNTVGSSGPITRY